jgi:hypothetical protein
MEGCTWKVIDEWTSEEPPVMTFCADCLDQERCYRIVCYLIGSPPWLVRASFHDYDCSDYEASKRFFEPIIQSIQIHA